MHFVPAGGLGNQDCFESPCTEAGPFSSLLKDKGQDRQEWSQGPAELCLGQYKPRRHTSPKHPSPWGGCQQLGRSSEHTLSEVGWVWHLHNFKCSSWPRVETNTVLSFNAWPFWGQMRCFRSQSSGYWRQGFHPRAFYSPILCPHTRQDLCFESHHL